MERIAVATWAEAVSRYRAELAREAALVAGGPRPLLFPDRNPRYGWYLVHLNTCPGQLPWRVTRFGQGLEPHGHSEAATFERAVAEARERGANLMHPDPENIYAAEPVAPLCEECCDEPALSDSPFCAGCSAHHEP